MLDQSFNYAEAIKNGKLVLKKEETSFWRLGSDPDTSSFKVVTEIYELINGAMVAFEFLRMPQGKSSPSLKMVCASPLETYRKWEL